MHLSYWEKKELYNPNQIIIIGSGIVGLTTAIYIKEKDPKLPVLILERGSLPLGASTKNAGFACFGSVSEILDDLTRMEEREVIQLIGNRIKGLSRLLSIVDPSEIEYSNTGGYEVFSEDQEMLYSNCLENINKCNDLVESAAGFRETFQLIESNGAVANDMNIIYNPYEGMLNPFKMVSQLIKKAKSMGVLIVNNQEVQSVDRNSKVLSTDHLSEISYHKLVICTNGFARKIFNELQVHPVRNQVLMTQPIDGLKLEGCYHYNQGYVYFRNYQGRLLLGGGRNIALHEESTDVFGNTDTIQSFLMNFLYDVIGISKAIKVDHWWSGILGVGPVKSTIIDEYHPDHFLGVRMGGMGVALGSEVGHKLASLVVMN